MALCKRSPRLFWLAAVAGFHAGILLFYVFNFSYTYVPHLPTAISVSNEILSGSAVDNSRQKRENENIIGTNWDKLSERQVRILNCSGLDVTNNTQRVPVDFNVEPKPYLADYVNPCWYESLDSDEPYSSNGYFGEDLPFHKQARPFLMKMHGLWRARKAVGLHTRLRCLPYFYVAGNPKCGSTDFYSNLIMHPKVTGGYTKETQWWVRFRIGLYFNKWVSMNSYVDLFDPAALQIQEQRENDRHSMIIGDGTVGLLHLHDRWPLYPGNEGHDEPHVLVAHHIRKLTPQARMVILMRNPTDRVYSDYYQHHRDMGFGGTSEAFHSITLKGIEQASFCLRERGLRACAYDACLNRQTIGLSMSLRVGLYYAFVRDWINIFPRDQLKFISFDDYTNNRTGTLLDAWNFLGVGAPPKEVMAVIEKAKKVRNQRQSRQASDEMWPETKKLLDTFYRPFNRLLSDLIGDERFLFES